MPRLFIAVDLPQEIKDKIAELKTDIPTARWVKPYNMHITLKFLGEIDEDRAQDVQSILETVHCKPFDLKIRGAGAFPTGSYKPPRILWVGTKKQSEFNALHRDVNQTLKNIGIPAENKPFHPHITIARLKSNKRLPQVYHFLERYYDFFGGRFRVEKFALVESLQSTGSAQYTKRAVYGLK